MGKGGAPGDTALKEQTRESEQIFAELRPQRSALNEAILSTLKNPSDPKIPVLDQISKANAANKSAALGSTAESIRRAGMEGTPTGRAILAQSAVNINKAASDDKNAFITKFLENIPAILQGQGGLAASQGSSAAQNLSSIGAAQAQAKQAVISGIGTGIGTAAGYGASAYLNSGGNPGIARSAYKVD